MSSLANLPPEILYQIAWELFPFYPSDDADIRLVTNEFFDFTALARLSRVSKLFRDVAQPILFHIIPPLTQKTTSIIKTLHTRPNLAAFVRKAWIGSGEAAGKLIPSGGVYRFGPDNKLDASPADVFMLNDLMSKQFQTNSDNQSESEEINVLAALPATLAPNIESLVINQYSTAVASFKPELFCNLTELALNHRNHLGEVNPQGLKQLLRAMPALQIFRCCLAAAIPSLVPHERVHTLDFVECALDRQSFQNVFDGFPNVQNFRYKSGEDVSDWEEAKPAEMFEAIRTRRSSIKNLEICILKALYFDEIEPQDCINSLASMHALQSLTITSRALVPHSEETNGNVLTNFLPRGIRRFTLVKAQSNLDTDIQRLAESGAEQFPDLVFSTLDVEWTLEDDYIHYRFINPLIRKC
ncbi:hypothetical protein QQS21_000105 [Conoideocrella luteorostrata]|uniref:F-box domain-containing protein n=1 Tax=Conoideocrella luteorostrata TaxID=1105319 RepID=A0AAJ0FYV5_9HYPO|nr:hypothetical protein QQS21_000105 [Conoideocrella luteorostrata]